jgi:hypothetical protein
MPWFAPAGIDDSPYAATPQEGQIVSWIRQRFANSGHRVAVEQSDRPREICSSEPDTRTDHRRNPMPANPSAKRNSISMLLEQVNR